MFSTKFWSETTDYNNRLKVVSAFFNFITLEFSTKIGNQQLSIVVEFNIITKSDVARDILYNYFGSFIRVSNYAHPNYSARERGV